MLAEIETYVDKPETPDPKTLEELGKQSEVLDSKSKAAFQRAKELWLDCGLWRSDPGPGLLIVASQRLSPLSGYRHSPANPFW